MGIGNDAKDCSDLCIIIVCRIFLFQNWFTRPLTLLCMHYQYHVYCQSLLIGTEKYCAMFFLSQ